MPYSFEFRPGYVVVTVEGMLNLEEESEGFRSLLSSAEFESPTSIILDNRARTPGTDLAHMRAMADVMGAALRRFEIPRFAMVASTMHSFGMGALFEKLSKERDLPTNARTFESLDNAIAWVEQRN